MKLGQVIILPEVSSEDIKENSIARAKQKVRYHQTSTNETVLDISQIHNVPIEDIISMNQLNETSDLEIGAKLQIREYKNNSTKVTTFY